jgi:putative ABC transport system ATP-binding protein
MDERETKMALEIFRVLAHREQRCVILMTRTREAASAADEIWGLNKGILTFVKENADF